MNRTSGAFVSQSLFSVMVLLMIGGSAGAQDQSTRTAEWQYRPDLLRPYWQTNIVEGESLLFVKDEQSGIARASLLYPVKKILYVRNSAGDVNYEEGRDFLWTPDSREITLPKDSRIPAFTEQQLRRPSGSQKYELTHRDGNGEIFFGSRLEYHEMQTCFTYQHATEGVLPPVQSFDPTALPRTVQRLLNKQPVSMVVVGDSISAGCNASGWAEGAPFQPAYPELFRRYLEERFVAKTTLTNPSVSGTDTQWVLNTIDRVVESAPNLVIVAFGMNDAAGRPAAEYQKNIRSIISKIREKQPECEFILVASMLGNRNWTRLNPDLFPQYRDSLLELREPGVAVADLTSVWTDFLKHKQDRDQTGNGVNHPNDFGHRVYAQVLAHLITPPPEPQPGQGAGTTVTAGPLLFTEHVLLSGYTYSYAVVAGDLDGDGDVDLTTADAESNNSLYLLRNEGAGSFQRSHIQRYQMQDDQALRMERHAMGDLNGDGHPDVVIVDNRQWDIRWFQNPGPQQITSEWKAHRVCAPKELPGAYDVAISDLDLDGDPDIAASSWRHGNRFDWFENCGSPGRGGQWIRHEIDASLSETRTIAAADFNHDGRPDLLGTARTGHQILWYKNTAGSMSEPVFQRHLIDDQTQFPAHAHPVDMDGDQDLDIVAAFGIAASINNDSPDSHQVAWYENQGTPGYGAHWQKHVIEASFPQGFEAVAGDLDGDGDIDVVATGWSAGGRLAWFENPGDPRGNWKSHRIRSDWPNANTVIISDLDHDGRPDIAACAERGANELRWWRNNGRGKP
jgi:lysophospholipase L1-like esterase